MKPRKILDDFSDPTLVDTDDDCVCVRLTQATGTRAGRVIMRYTPEQSRQLRKALKRAERELS